MIHAGLLSILLTVQLGRRTNAPSFSPMAPAVMARYDADPIIRLVFAA